MDLTPPDAWFHQGEGSKNPILDNRKRGSGQMNIFERLQLESDAQSLSGVGSTQPEVAVFYRGETCG